MTFRKRANALKRRCLQSKESLLDGEPYRFIDNGSNILAVAHCDFVGCGLESKFSRKGKQVKSTTLDDRLGAHIILDLLPSMGIKTDVLLTDDEEIGASTAEQFETDRQYNWIVQFDRRGDGAVVYDYIEMTALAVKYFGTLHDGSFSDISMLRHLQCGGINIGTGYYNEHTPESFADLSIVADQVNRFARMYADFGDVAIPHTNDEYTYGGGTGRYSESWDHWEAIEDDDDDDDRDFGDAHMRDLIDRIGRERDRA